MKFIFRIHLFWLIVVFATATAGAQSDTHFWQRQNIYQIFTDRFFDGNSANNNASGSYNVGGSTSVHGGDFRGIEQKLDYIKALGATAIWISPIVLNAYGEYHGYAGTCGPGKRSIHPRTIHLDVVNNGRSVFLVLAQTNGEKQN